MHWKLFCFEIRCFFLCISWEKDAEEGNHVASDGSKSLQTMTKIFYTHMLNPSENFTFCLQMRCTSGRRRKCCRECLATSDRQELVLFFNSGLPTLAGCPLSARALSTPRFPSIPGLFLCGRQHPASGCLTVSEHPRTWAEHDHWDNFSSSETQKSPSNCPAMAIQSLTTMCHSPDMWRNLATLSHMV